MGSCGMQCMLSGLPEGREVRTGVLFLNTYESYRLYNGAPRYSFNGEYHILLPPLWGRYDDFGKVRVDDEDGVLCSWASSYLRKTGANFDDLHDLQRQVQDRIVSIKQTSRGTLSYALVREDVWNDMVATSVQNAISGNAIYRLPRFKDQDELLEAFDLAMDSVLNNTDLEQDTLAYRIHRLLFAGRMMPEIYVFNVKGNTVPAEITRSAFETLMVEMWVEELGIMLHPGLTGSQVSNIKARRTFFERMMRICDQDIKRGPVDEG